jgi:hypothetical protein
VEIKVRNYRTTSRPDVQAFVDLEIGSWRANGIHYQRDGRLRPAQLTPMIQGRRAYIPSVEILHAALRKQWEAAIVEAIRKHIETLPPEKRMKAPRAFDEPKTSQPQPANGKRLRASSPTLAELARIIPKAEPVQPTRPLAVPPPARLLVSRRTL